MHMSNSRLYLLASNGLKPTTELCRVSPSEPSLIRPVNHTLCFLGGQEGRVEDIQNWSDINPVLLCFKGIHRLVGDECYVTLVGDLAERERLTAMVQNIDSILKGLANSFVGASMGTNTDASGMSGFNTGGGKFVGESTILSPKVLEDFVTTHA